MVLQAEPTISSDRLCLDVTQCTECEWMDPGTGRETLTADRTCQDLSISQCDHRTHYIVATHADSSGAITKFFSEESGGRNLSLKTPLLIHLSTPRFKRALRRPKFNALCVSAAFVAKTPPRGVSTGTCGTLTTKTSDVVRSGSGIIVFFEPYFMNLNSR